MWSRQTSASGPKVRAIRIGAGLTELGSIKTHRICLLQVFGNLLTNAAESIAQATGLQKEKSADIERSMGRIQEATGSLVVSSNEMKATVGALTAAAQKLHDELGKFTV